MNRSYLAIAAIVLAPATLTLTGGCSDDDQSCHDENGCPSTHGAGGHGEGGSGATGSNTGGDGTGATGAVGGGGGIGGAGGAEGGAGGG